MEPVILDCSLSYLDFSPKPITKTLLILLEEYIVTLFKNSPLNFSIFNAELNFPSKIYQLYY